MSNIVKNRRKKVELTVEQKKEICNFYRENRNLTHMTITQYFSEKYQKTLNRSSITRILKKSEYILELGDEKQLTMRNRSAKYPHLEEALFNCSSEITETKSPEEEIIEFDETTEEQHDETNHVFIEHYDFDDIDDQNNVEIDESSNLMQSNFGEIVKCLEGSEFWSQELFEATELVKKSLSHVLSAKKQFK